MVVGTTAVDMYKYTLKSVISSLVQIIWSDEAAREREQKGETRGF